MPSFALRSLKTEDALAFLSEERSNSYSRPSWFEDISSQPEAVQSSVDLEGQLSHFLSGLAFLGSGLESGVLPFCQDGSRIPAVLDTQPQRGCHDLTDDSGVALGCTSPWPPGGRAYFSHQSSQTS